MWQGGAHMKHGHHASRGSGKKKQQGPPNPSAPSAGLGHRMRMAGGPHGHMNFMHLHHPVHNGAFSHQQGGARGYPPQQKKAPRSGFHTEPSSPTYGYPQYYGGKHSSPSPTAGASSQAFLAGQPAGYLHNSPPLSASHAGTNGVGMGMGQLSLGDGRGSASSPHLPSQGGPQQTFSRTQSHPAHSFVQGSGGGGMVKMGQGQPHRSLGGQPSSPGYELPYMKGYSRSRSSSANVQQQVGGMGMRRGGGGPPPLSPPMPTQRSVQHAQQYGGPQSHGFPLQQPYPLPNTAQSHYSSSSNNFH